MPAPWRGPKAHLLLDCDPQILHEMEPISHLARLPRTLTNSLRIETVADRRTEPSHQALARTAARAMAEQTDNLSGPPCPAKCSPSRSCPGPADPEDQPCRFYSHAPSASSRAASGSYDNALVETINRLYKVEVI